MPLDASRSANCHDCAAVALVALHGYHNPAAMAFYATALRFSAVTVEHITAPVEDDGTAKRNPKGFFDWLFGNDYTAATPIVTAPSVQMDLDVMA